MWTRTDLIPPVVRSIHRAQCRHSRLAFDCETRLGFRAQALAINSPLELCDLPVVPRDRWIFFRPSIAGFGECTRLGEGSPMLKEEAITILHAVASFALRFEAWSRALITELSVLAVPMRIVDLAPSLFGFKKNTPWVWTTEAIEVVNKWENVREREEELDRWIDEAKLWIGRLEDAIRIQNPVAVE